MEEEKTITSISEYLEAVKAATSSEDGVYIYRGQRNSEWELRSAAARRLLKIFNEKNGGNGFNHLFLLYHKIYLIEKAKMKGYHREGEREFKDLEVLAKLQHHGAATCLMDFTINPLCALWFACQDDTKNEPKNGTVFIINSDNPSKIRNLMYDDLGKSFDDILAFNTRKEDKEEHPDEHPLLWRWEPEGFDPRISGQDSVFLFGLPSVPKGLIKQDITIDKDAKKDILQELKSMHINAETLFKDLSGFASVNAHHSPLEKFKDAEQYFTTDSSQQEKEVPKIFDGAQLNRANDHYNFGLVNSILGRYKEAIEYYNKAIELNPKYAEAYNNLGHVKIDLGKYEEAIKDYDKAIELNPNDANAYTNRGATKLKLEQHEDAIKDFDKAIELNPNGADAYNNRGNAKGELGQHEEANKDYDKAIELNPEYAMAYNNRGVTKGLLGQNEEAIKDYDKAIELNPNYAEAYINRGVEKVNLGQYQKAINDFDKAIELNPNYASAYNNRGNTKGELGQHEEANKDFDKAIELNPKYANAYSNRGLAKVDLGWDVEAIKDFSEAIRLNPNYAAAYNNRGNAYKKLGRNEEANEDFRKFIQLTEEQLK